MPDLTIFTVAYYPSAKALVQVKGSKGNVFEGRTAHHDFGWIFQCTGRKYRPHKHIKQVKETACEWSELTSLEPYKGDGKCPCCGESVEFATMGG
jgi:hypothetical protein